MMKPAETDDKALIEAMKKGSEAAFTMLFDRYYHKLYSFSLKMLRSKDTSQEIVHGTFIRIWNTKDRISDVLSFEPYLIVIAKNLIVDHVRKIATEKDYLKEVKMHQATHTNNTTESIEYNELIEISNKAVNAMPEKQREIYKLSRDEGLSYNQIAERLGISSNTVKVHIYNSLKHIKKSLGTSDIDR
jgi:RNA polymerase sigma-70 factor (family 1)